MATRRVEVLPDPESDFKATGPAVTRPKTDPFVWIDEFDLDLNEEELSQCCVIDLIRDMYNLIYDL